MRLVMFGPSTSSSSHRSIWGELPEDARRPYRACWNAAAEDGRCTLTGATPSSKPDAAKPELGGISRNTVLESLESACSWRRLKRIESGDVYDDAGAAVGLSGGSGTVGQNSHDRDAKSSLSSMIYGYRCKCRDRESDSAVVVLRERRELRQESKVSHYKASVAFMRVTVTWMPASPQAVSNSWLVLGASVHHSLNRT
jgi:hypothetical protein